MSDSIQETLARYRSLRFEQDRFLTFQDLFQKDLWNKVVRPEDLDMASLNRMDVMGISGTWAIPFLTRRATDHWGYAKRLPWLAFALYGGAALSEVILSADGPSEGSYWQLRTPFLARVMDLWGENEALILTGQPPKTQT